MRASGDFRFRRFHGGQCALFLSHRTTEAVVRRSPTFRRYRFACTSVRARPGFRCCSRISRERPPVDTKHRHPEDRPSCSRMTRLQPAWLGAVFKLSRLLPQLPWKRNGIIGNTSVENGDPPLFIRFSSFPSQPRRGRHSIYRLSRKNTGNKPVGPSSFPEVDRRMEMKMERCPAAWRCALCLPWLYIVSPTSLILQAWRFVCELGLAEVRSSALRAPTKLSDPCT